MPKAGPLRVAVIGTGPIGIEAAALEQVPKIRQLLSRLDPQLFRFAGGAPDPQRS